MSRAFSIVIALLSAACLAHAAPQEQAAAPADSVKTTGAAQAASEHVKRAVFATSIADREPAGEVVALDTDSERVYFFTEIVGMDGKSITHRWMYGGETKAEIHFQIGGERWRVYSSKTLVPEWTGTWSVEVIDGEGNKLYVATLDYQKAQ